MSNPTEDRLEANPKIDITLQGLDDELLTMQARLRPGARTLKVERAIRRYMGSDIQDDDTVQIYRDGEILRADDRLGNDSQLLHYRVSRATTNAEHSSSAQVTTISTSPAQVTTTSTDTHVAEIPGGGTRRIQPFTLQGPVTVGQLRQRFARASGIADPNTVEVYLAESPRAGPLEGNHWQLGSVTQWPHQQLVARERPHHSYVLLRGTGGEYLCQQRLGGDGISVRVLRWWLRDKLIRRVHRTLDTQISVVPTNISLYADGRLLARDTYIVPWTAEVEFRLPPNVEAAFSAEENWLCPSFECSLCQETFQDMAPTITARCTHEQTACAACIRRWVANCLNDDGWNKARCPFCSTSLAYDDIKTHVSKQDFERYEMLATKAAVGSIPNFHWCLQEGCDSGQIHEPARGAHECPDTLFVCHECGGRQCTRHAVRWHERRTCDEYERQGLPRLRQEKASELTIQGVSKRCPGCNRSVSKEVGCNHITCVCGREWCYLCQASWTQSPRTNIPFCKHRPECPEAGAFNNPFHAHPRPEMAADGYQRLLGGEDGGMDVRMTTQEGRIRAIAQETRDRFIANFRNNRLLPENQPPPGHHPPPGQPPPRNTIRGRPQRVVGNPPPPHNTPHNIMRGGHHPVVVNQTSYQAMQHFQNHVAGARDTRTFDPAPPPPHLAENPGGPPQTLLRPGPLAPRNVDRQHGMRPDSFFAPRPDAGSFAPEPGPETRSDWPNLQRRQQASTDQFWEQEPTEWGQRHLVAGEGGLQADQDWADYQAQMAHHAREAHRALMDARARGDRREVENTERRYFEVIRYSTGPDVRRPQVKMPVERDTLVAWMRST